MGGFYWNDVNDLTSIDELGKSFDCKKVKASIRGGGVKFPGMDCSFLSPVIENKSPPKNSVIEPL